MFLETDGKWRPPSFWAHLFAVCRRRWRLALTLIVLTGGGVAILAPAGAAELIGTAAVVLPALAAALIGGLSFRGRQSVIAKTPNIETRPVTVGIPLPLDGGGIKGGGDGRNPPHSPPSCPSPARGEGNRATAGLGEWNEPDRQNRFLAETVFGVVTWALLAGVALAPLLADPDLIPEPKQPLGLLSSPQVPSIWPLVAEYGQVLAAGAALSLAAFLGGLAWAACTRGWWGSPVLGLFSAGLVWLGMFELVPVDKVFLHSQTVPVAALCFGAVLVLGWALTAYRSVVRRPPAKVSAVRLSLPILAFLAAVPVGFGVQAGLATTHVRGPVYERLWGDCVPSPDGRWVAHLMAGPDWRDKRHVWAIIDTHNGTRRMMPGLSSHWAARGWSPDGRYFLYPVPETATRYFLRTVFPCHVARRDWLQPARLLCYDTANDSVETVAAGGAATGDYVGWVGESRVRFVRTAEFTERIDVTIRDVDVSTGAETTRVVAVRARAPRFVGDWDASRFLAFTGDPKPRFNTGTAHLVDLDSGTALTGPCMVPSPSATVIVLGPSHIAVLDAGAGTPAGPRGHALRVIDLSAGRDITLPGVSLGGCDEYVGSPWLRRRPRRWVHVIQRDRDGQELAHGLLDLETGRFHRRDDLTAEMFYDAVVPSPGERHWLLPTADFHANRYRLWTLPLGDPEAKPVAHDSGHPPDPRVIPTALFDTVAWVNDREIVYLSQMRHLVFYDVVAKKRTRVVTVR